MAPQLIQWCRHFILFMKDISDADVNYLCYVFLDYKADLHLTETLIAENNA